MTTVPDRRGPPPPGPRAAAGPVVQENLGRSSPERTFADLLKNPYDEALFEYHARSTLTVVDLNTGLSHDFGPPALYTSVGVVGDGSANGGSGPAPQFLLTERLQRPFSYSLTWEDFPRIVELRSREGKVLRELARLPMKQGVPAGRRADRGRTASRARPSAMRRSTGSRRWTAATRRGRSPTGTASCGWTRPSPARCRRCSACRTRFARLLFMDDGQNALMTEIDRNRAWTRTYVLPLNGSQSRPLFDHSLREKYRFPGTPMMRTLPGNGRSVVIAGHGELLLSGPGASPRGDRPFLDRLAIRDLTTTRLFQSADTQYEQPLLVLDGGRLVTQRESATEPPNLVLRDGTGSSALTRAKDPTPQLRKIRRELVSFKRGDGVDMSFWLYLPPDFKEGERRPALVWAYPLEFADDATAGQVSGSANRFNVFVGLSPLNLLMEGFIVLSDATMPIVGDPRKVNDDFVEQVVANARAIVDKADELGMIDTRRLAIGGHSYGAFLTANLLAHTDLFKAGIARSGATTAR